MPPRGISRKAVACSPDAVVDMGVFVTDRARASVGTLPLREGETREVQVETRTFWPDVGLLLEAGCSYEGRARVLEGRP